MLSENKEKPQKKVIFDLDGVLLKSEENLSWLDRALTKTLREYGLEVSDSNLQKLYPGNVPRIKEIGKELGIEPKKLWKTRNFYYTREKIIAMKNREIEPYQDVSALYTLKKSSYFLGIITNSPQEVVNIFVKEFNFKDLFDIYIGRGPHLEDLKKIKPAPFFFKKLKEKVNGKKFIYVGDRKSDKKFAKNTGMTFLSFKRNNNEFQDLKQVVTHLLSI